MKEKKERKRSWSNSAYTLGYKSEERGGRFLEMRPTGWPHGCWRFKFTLCPPFWRLEVKDQGANAFLRGWGPSPGWQMAATSLVPTRPLLVCARWEGWALVSLPLLTRTLIPTWELHSHWSGLGSSKPNQLPNVSPPNTVTLDIRTSTCEFWKNTFSP